MGWLDSLLGRSTPPPADLDALFAVPQAALSLQAQGFTPTGQGAVCYRSGEGGAFANAERQIEQLVATDGAQVTTSDDAFGFRWISVAGIADTSALATNVHAANSTLVDAGFGSSLLCSTVGFTGPDQQPMALVYLFKQGTFYPFVPQDGQRRDNALELQVRGIVDGDLRVEPDLSKWLAIWGAPGL